MDEKCYYSLYQYNMDTFGGRVFKASLDAGLTCPNRDGTLGTGGCIYCDQGSRYFSGTGSISRQMAAERERIHKKWPEARLTAYFQAGTNTYAPAERLRALWTEALDCPDTVGLSVATRADCLGPEILDLLSEFREKTHLTVELGLQTVHDGTAQSIGRGHDFAVFLRGCEALKARHIRVCVHLIDGLPGEDEEMMLESARQVGLLEPGGVKLHLLHVNEGTALAELWRQGRYTPLERAEYVTLVTEQLRYFPPKTVIERLTGDGCWNPSGAGTRSRCWGPSTNGCGRRTSGRATGLSPKNPQKKILDGRAPPGTILRYTH